MHWPNQISGTIKSTRRILDKTGSLLKEMGTLYLSTLQYLFVKPKKSENSTYHHQESLLSSDLLHHLGSSLSGK